jgi:hypothetical protein
MVAPTAISMALSQNVTDKIRYIKRTNLINLSPKQQKAVIKFKAERLLRLVLQAISLLQKRMSGVQKLGQ